MRETVRAVRSKRFVVPAKFKSNAQPFLERPGREAPAANCVRHLTGVVVPARQSRVPRCTCMPVFDEGA